jgi:hypothetical protein
MQHVQTVEQIFAEPSGLDFSHQIAIGRGDDAHVDAGVHAIGADALQFAGFEEPQQDCLHARAHLADFVEKDGAVGRRLEDAGLVADCVGEAAAHVAEELGLEQRFGQAGAIDGGHRGETAAAAVMNHPRHEVLADAGLTGDEDLRVRSRRKLDLAAQRFRRCAAADEGEF